MAPCQLVLSQSSNPGLTISNRQVSRYRGIQGAQLTHGLSWTAACMHTMPLTCLPACLRACTLQCRNFSSRLRIDMKLCKCSSSFTEIALTHSASGSCRFLQRATARPARQRTEKKMHPWLIFKESFRRCRLRCSSTVRPWYFQPRPKVPWTFLLLWFSYT